MRRMRLIRRIVPRCIEPSSTGTKTIALGPSEESVHAPGAISFIRFTRRIRVEPLNLDAGPTGLNSSQ
jgi:hypothetical protein